MDSSRGGTSSFQWGDCISDPSAPDEFPDISGFSGSSGCGFLSQEALKMSTCFNTQSMGFICENPAGIFINCNQKIHAQLFEGVIIFYD